VELFRNLITFVNLLLRGSFQSLFCDHVESDLCGCCYFITHSHTQHSSSGGERVVSSDEDCTPQLSHRYCTCDALILRHTRRVTVHLSLNIHDIEVAAQNVKHLKTHSMDRDSIFFVFTAQFLRRKKSPGV
jgi:hypothetical protein